MTDVMTDIITELAKSVKQGANADIQILDVVKTVITRLIALEEKVDMLMELHKVEKE